MTISLDFDGVINAYSRGWNGGVIDPEPMPGMVAGVRELLATGEPVFVLTARRDTDAVVTWLESHGLPAMAWLPDTECRPDHDHFWNVSQLLLVTNRKYPARVYVDDRALLFTDWPTTVARIKAQPIDGSVVDPVAAIRHTLLAIHVRDEQGFCTVCVGDYDAYDDAYEWYRWPCPTLGVVGVEGSES